MVQSQPLASPLLEALLDAIVHLAYHVAIIRPSFFPLGARDQPLHYQAIRQKDEGNWINSGWEGKGGCLCAIGGSDRETRKKQRSTQLQKVHALLHIGPRHIHRLPRLRTQATAKTDSRREERSQFWLLTS